MTYTQTFVEAATPTDAYVSNALNQGVGYYFDKAVGIGITPASSGLKLNGLLTGVTTVAGSSVDGIYLNAGSAYANNTVRARYSPRISMASYAWNSATSLSNKVMFGIEVIPDSGGVVIPAPTISTQRLAFSANYAGGGYSEIMSLYGDGTPAGKNGFANGEATFSSGASADTVTISGALTTDIYTFDWTSDPGTPGAVWFERKAGSFIVHTAGAVTGTPSWMWTRRKTLP